MLTFAEGMKCPWTQVNAWKSVESLQQVLIIGVSTLPTSLCYHFLSQSDNTGLKIWHEAIVNTSKKEAKKERKNAC